MDYAKTGELIAARRKEYGFTQKQLAEKLSVSDRAISKWERGVGFPDISLLEPLADELRLSVIELLHGEKADAEATIDAAAESSARDTVRSLNGEFQRRLKTVRKHSRMITAITVIVAILAATALLIYRNYDDQILKTKDVTMAYAVAKMPTVIITVEEYALANYVLDLESVRQLIEKDVLAEELDTSVTAELSDRIHINGKPPDTLTITVFREMVFIDYTIGNYRYILQFSSTDHIIKVAAQYDSNWDIKYLFENSNNVDCKEGYMVKAWIPTT